ncbi:MAG: hypothetical protein HYT39_01100 [Candidatus Sungbacteria bacterium]|nr:hypothetical protein [Candidatus Sungbacteria bacterium]
MPENNQRQELKQALEAEKTRLEKSLAGFATRDKKDPENWGVKYPDMTSRGISKEDLTDENADEVEEFDALLETEDALEDRLREVNRALQKIDTDKYGLCEKCSEPIPMERLSANPAARFDIKHSG